VANGIGGRTVAEAKMRMPYSEFVNWCEYRRRQGGLNVGLRIDRAISRALSAHFNSMSKGSKFKPLDFSPYDAEKQGVDVNDPQSMLMALKGATNGKTRHTDG